MSNGISPSSTSVRFAYSPRGLRLHPYRWPRFMAEAERRRLYHWICASGFDGLEVEDIWLDFGQMTDRDVTDLRHELDAAGTPAAAFKVPEASLVHAGVAEQNRRRLHRGVEVASTLGATILTFSLPAVPEALGRATHADLIGRTESPGASATATDLDVEETARVLREVADRAAPLGVQLSIEIHQNSVADNSRSALRLLNRIDRPNVGVNPDLGNLFWHYAVPEESPDEAIQRLAPRANYWHVKNLRRIYFDELQRSLFQRVTVPDGELDYRWAVDVMKAAGFRGWVVVEGADSGDQLHSAEIGLAYLHRLFR